jgi:RNA polymerase sigma-70 factor (ECF subfamily)
MPLTEQQLLDRAKAGDRQAMGELLSNYQNRLFNVALRMVNNRDDAAEVTQDAMLKAVEHLKGYDGRSQLSTWMIRITMNLSISHLRKRKLRKMASLDADNRSGGAPGGGGGGGAGFSPGSSGGGSESHAMRDRLEDDLELSAEQCVEEDEMLAEMNLAMDRLDEEFRSVLVLRDINEMDYREIADVLEVPVGTVKSRLFRARLALREEMSKVYPELKRVE